MELPSGGGVRGEAKCRLVGGKMKSGRWGAKVRVLLFGGGTGRTSNEINTISIRPRGKSLEPHSYF